MKRYLTSKGLYLVLPIMYYFSHCVPHPYDDTINLKNKSNLIITEFHIINSVSRKYAKLNQSQMPDSIYPYPINPGQSTQIFIDRLSSIKNYLKTNPDKKLTIYIFDFDTCVKYSKMPDLLLKKALKKIELSEKDISREETFLTFKK